MFIINLSNHGRQVRDNIERTERNAINVTNPDSKRSIMFMLDETIGYMVNKIFHRMQNKQSAF